MPPHSVEKAALCCKGSRTRPLLARRRRLCLARQVLSCNVELSSVGDSILLIRAKVLGMRLSRRRVALQEPVRSYMISEFFLGFGLTLLHSSGVRFVLFPFRPRTTIGFQQTPIIDCSVTDWKKHILLWASYMIRETPKPTGKQGNHRTS